MSSFVYSSFIDEMVRNAYDIPSGDYKAMFVTEHYAANKDHTRRSDVTDEIVGQGYQVRGYPVTLSVGSSEDDDVTLDISPFNLTNVDFKARGMVIYRANGGRAVDDQLVAFVSFNGTFVFRGDFEMAFSPSLLFR